MAFISASGIACAAPTAASAISPGRTRGRRLTAIAAALAAAAMLAGASPIGRLEVGLDHVRSTRGLIRVCLTADPDNFPGCVDDAQAVTRSISADRRSIAFDGLAPGSYAVSVIHDENANHRLDTFAGVPREGYGFSRNPPVMFGPPRFAAARFGIASDTEKQQVRMRYIL